MQYASRGENDRGSGVIWWRVLVLTDSAMPSELSRLLSENGMDGGGRGSSPSLVELSQSGGIPPERFLQSFCRYCQSNPFYCGEMIQLCYAEARTAYW